MLDDQLKRLQTKLHFISTMKLINLSCILYGINLSCILLFYFYDMQMREIIIKAYGWLELNSHDSDDSLTDCLTSLHGICREWYLDENIFSLEDNLLQISHEGDYFPHEDVAMVLAKYISKESKGKLDIIDLEAWTLLRFFLDPDHNSILLKNEQEKLPYSRKSSLDHVLEASQNKNGSAYIA